MRKFTFFLLLIGAAVLYSGCQTSGARGRADFIPTFVNFYKEVPENQRTRSGETITMPISRTEITVDPKAVIVEWDIRDVEVFDTRDGPAFLFRLTREAARDFTRGITDRELRIVGVVSPQGAGLAPMAGVVSIRRGFVDGNIVMYLEIPDEEAENVAYHLSRTAREIQHEISQRR